MFSTNVYKYLSGEVLKLDPKRKIDFVYNISLVSIKPLKGFLQRKLTFDMLLSIKKYEKMFYTLGCKNVPNESY